MAFLHSSTLRAQEPLLPDAPVAKVQSQSFLRRLFPFDRFEWTMAAVQGSAEFFDGYETHVFTHRDIARCNTCTEADPFARFFDGARPSWPRLIIFGTMEDWATTYLDHRLRKSQHKLVRWLAPAPQVTLVLVHIKYGKSVDRGDDCLPGWVEIGYTCYAPGMALPSSTTSRKIHFFSTGPARLLSVQPLTSPFVSGNLNNR